MIFPKHLFSKKELVIAVHGFGRKTLHEFDPLKAWLEKQGFEVWTFAYFEPENEEDTSLKDWISRCEAVLRKAVSEKRTIHLLGFSMGGIIASYLASVYPVRDLLLCAPAFYPIDFAQIERITRQKLFQANGHDSGSMSTQQTKTFLQVVSSYRNSILQVDCPILILHGTADDVISYRSSRRILSLLDPAMARLILIEGARHRFLYDGPYESIAYPIIRDFFRGEMTPFEH